MTKRLNSRQVLLRMTGCCFALVLACLFVQPASAITIHSGTYSEDGNPDGSGDTFNITNGAGSEDIISVVIDLTLSPNVVLDTAGGGSFDFTPGAGEGTEVGLVSSVYVDGGQTLTLTFNDFNANETFTFQIDLDDTVGGATVTGADIAGAEITATSLLDGDVTTAMVAGAPTGNWASPIPEPNTMALLGLGLTGLAWGGRRRTNRR